MLSTLLLTFLASAPQEAFPAKAPTPEADPHIAFQAESAGGLRYLWWLPEGYDGATPTNLTVILHGTGLDYRWGAWNNKPGLFRPHNIVVSVDGPSPGSGNTRLFLGEQEDAEQFRAFLDELRQQFAVQDIYLYGHSQGGFFVIYYAGEFPETVAGVVAHASGAWNWTNMSKGLRKVAVAFMHGTADPVVPYRQSTGSRGYFAEAGFDLTHVRRLIKYNHWPNAVRANEALGWCEGMTTEDPALALEIAAEMLRLKGNDEYQWQTVPSFSGAHEVLRRFTKKGHQPFRKAASREQTERAERWLEQIEEHAELHVARLKESVPKRMTLDGGPWLGHLISVREDFRGVKPVETYVKKLGFDKTLRKHEEAANQLISGWYADGANARKQFQTVVELLGEAYLFEGFPHDMASNMKDWHRDASMLVIPSEALDRYQVFEDWSAGWKSGLDEYEELWRRWKGVAAD